jgi:hypothetical protein
LRPRWCIYVFIRTLYIYICYMIFITCFNIMFCSGYLYKLQLYQL